jgi:hypothetical protein
MRSTNWLIRRLLCEISRLANIWDAIVSILRFSLDKPSDEVDIAQRRRSLAPSVTSTTQESDMGSSSFGAAPAASSALATPLDIETIRGLGDRVRGVARA